ncbi:MAG: PaaI family thioesterase [Pseudomonadota bacterium]
MSDPVSDPVSDRASGPASDPLSGSASDADALTLADPLWPERREELMTPAEIGAISGLDFIRGIAEGRLPSPPILRHMGARFTAVAHGRVEITATPSFAVYNPIGSVHGGWYGTLLDSALSCAVQTALPQGRGYTTLEYKVNILRAASERTGALRVIGRIDHVGRSTGIAHGWVEDDGGKRYATGSATCLVIDLPTAS